MHTHRCSGHALEQVVSRVIIYDSLVSSILIGAQILPFMLVICHVLNAINAYCISDWLQAINTGHVQDTEFLRSVPLCVTSYNRSLRLLSVVTYLLEFISKLIHFRLQLTPEPRRIHQRFQKGLRALTCVRACVRVCARFGAPCVSRCAFQCAIENGMDTQQQGGCTWLLAPLCTPSTEHPLS